MVCETWFTILKPVSLENNTLLIEAPSSFVCEFIEENYLNEFQAAVCKYFGNQITVDYKIIVDKTNSQSTTVRSQEFQPAIIKNQKPLSNTAPSATDAPQVQDLDSMLNTKYSFSNFIEGYSNKMARIAGETIAQNPGSTSFNPLFIHGSSGVGKTHLLNAIGMKVKERGYFTFNLSARTDLMFALPKDFVSLAFYGTPDEEGINRYDLSSLRLNGHAYLDLSGGYTHQINDKWTVGGRLHLLVGAAAGEASFEELYLEASSQEWKLLGKGNVNLSVPGVSFVPGSDGGIAELLVTDIENILSFYKPSLGAAIDLGVAYKPVPELTLSLSLKDIGFMYWNNLTSASGKIDGAFTGVYYDMNDPVNLVDSLLASVKGSLYVDNTKGGYVQETRGKLYVGAEYSFLRNMMSVGVMSKTEFMSKYVSEEVSLNYKIRPCHWFGISAGYSFVSGGWSTIGFGMDIKLPPFNFYVATDYTPLYYSAQGIPYKSQAVNVQAGVVLTFKTRDNAKRLLAKAEDFTAIPAVTEPVDVPAEPAVLAEPAPAVAE